MDIEKHIINNRQRVELKGYIQDLIDVCVCTTKQSSGTHLLIIDWGKVNAFAETTGQASTKQRILRALWQCDIGQRA